MGKEKVGKDVEKSVKNVEKYGKWEKKMLKIC